MTRFLVLALVVVGCSKSDAPAPAAKAAPTEASKAAGTAATPGAPAGRPASITDAQVASIDKLVAALTEAGTGLEKAPDCASKAITLKLSALEVELLLPEMASMLAQSDADPSVGTWFNATYKPRMEAAMSPLKASAMACKDDPEFMKALAAFPMMKKKS